MKKFTILLFTIIFFISCSSLKQKFVNPYDHVKKVPYWNQKNSDSKNMKSKVYNEIFGDILNYLREQNKVEGYSEIPAPFKLTKKENALLDRAFATIPSNINKKILPLIKGIFFVENLGSSGYTEFIYDSQGIPLYSFFIFDRKVLNMSANDWCTSKERSPFKMTDGFNLTCTLEKYSSAHGAFLYIFLHELGHAIQINNSFFPLAQENQASYEGFKDTEFFSNSWILNKQKAELKDSPFKNTTCKNLKYYTKQPECNPNDAFLIYESLTKSNLPTPYATNVPEDDFADSFANYFHAKILKKHFDIKLTQGEKIFNFKPCWGTERCLAKEQIFDKMLGITR